MSKQDTSIIETIQRLIILSKKINKALRPNTIPNTFEGLKKMEAELEAEEERRKKMNQMRENIRRMIKLKQERSRIAKLERRRKVKSFLHIKNNTLIEDELFKSENYQDDMYE